MFKYHIRTVRTASGAKAVQVIWYEKHRTRVAKHIGSAKSDDEVEILRAEARRYIAEHHPQLSLFEAQPQRIVTFDHIEVTNVSHRFTREILLNLADRCGLGSLDILYRDLAMMRIIEPCSKLRSIELLERYFDVSYTRYLYERMPKLLDQRAVIENAAIETAKSFNNAFAILLYDVTTLYFETHKSDDELQARGFSKDDKSKQPQIVIGLLVNGQGFPLIHEVFKGNTFEGHTMLAMVKAFHERHNIDKPIVVADAAMLSKVNQQALDTEGYRYIVGARLANAQHSFISELCNRLPKHDKAMIRMAFTDGISEVICTYSHARYKKQKREFDKQVDRAKMLIARKEPGKRAKFVKRSKLKDTPYLFDEALKQKAEQLLGIKGYCTNIPEDRLSNGEVVAYYHDLWRVEQAFRISKSDLKTRPIFHHSHEAIRAHVLICFMALMMAKFIEIKSGLSLRKARDMLWEVHEINLLDPLSGRERLVRTSLSSELKQLLRSLEIKNTY